jgi:hypothetical protein
VTGFDSPLTFVQDTMPTIALSTFVRRQTDASEFSHWTCPEADLLARVSENFEKAEPGYREGVVLVPVSPEGFFSAIVELAEGDVLRGHYKARRPGETPRRSVTVDTDAAGEPKVKGAAAQVDVVLYRADVLAEGDDRSTDAEWEIISVNASPIVGEVPLAPEAMIANHLVLDGGTATGWTDEEFAVKLRESKAFWDRHAMVSPME